MPQGRSAHLRGHRRRPTWWPDRLQALNYRGEYRTVIQSIGVSETPSSQDDITCIPVASVIDGDNITYNVVWTVNGNVVQTGQDETLAGPFSPLDDVVCSFTPNDGQSFDGTGDTFSANTTVLNTQPEISTSPSVLQRFKPKPY